MKIRQPWYHLILKVGNFMLVIKHLYIEMATWKLIHPDNQLPGIKWWNTLRQRQDGRHFPDDDFKRIFLNENVWISIDISLKFIPKGPIDNIPALVQIMAWRRSGDKPLSEPMLVKLWTHICVTRPQWAKSQTAAYQARRWCYICKQGSHVSVFYNKTWLIITFSLIFQNINT